jgi:uncharacterized protein (UPF0248 family)
MNRKVVAFKTAFVFSLLFSLHSNINVRAYSNLIQNYDIKILDSVYDVDEKKLVAEIPSSNIKLYFVKDDKDFGMFRGFILQINDVKKYFNWENVNRNRKPQLILSDLDKDDKDDLIVILNKGYGTGVQDEEVHVIKQELFFYEILVEEPLIPMYKKIKIEKTKEQITIILNNKKTVLNKRGMTALPYQELGAGYGHHVGFEVKNNILYSRILLGVGTNPGVGEFIIKYMYKDEIFQVHSINFIPNTEYLNK